MQYGIAWKTAFRQVAIAAGRPGRLTINAALRSPAICLDKIAVGTSAKLAIRIASPKPGNILSQTSAVASGVTSRGDGPVPPVVRTTAQPISSIRRVNASAIPVRSSGMRTRCGVHGETRTRLTYASIAGPPSSLYVPADARSEQVTIPIGTGAAMLKRRTAQKERCSRDGYAPSDRFPACASRYRARARNCRRRPAAHDRPSAAPARAIARHARRVRRA